LFTPLSGRNEAGRVLGALGGWIMTRRIWEGLRAQMITGRVVGVPEATDLTGRGWGR